MANSHVVDSVSELHTHVRLGCQLLQATTAADQLTGIVCRMLLLDACSNQIKLVTPCRPGFCTSSVYVYACCRNTVSLGCCLALPFCSLASLHRRMPVGHETAKHCWADMNRATVCIRSWWMALHALKLISLGYGVHSCVQSRQHWQCHITAAVIMWLRLTHEGHDRAVGWDWAAEMELGEGPDESVVTDREHILPTQSSAACSLLMAAARLHCSVGHELSVYSLE